MPSFRNFFSKKGNNDSDNKANMSDDTQSLAEKTPSNSNTNLGKGSYSQTDGFGRFISETNRNSNAAVSSSSTGNNNNKNDPTANEELRTSGSFSKNPSNNNNNNNKNGDLSKRPLSGWIDVGREIQLMPWPVCCAYLDNECEFMDNGNCCPYLHQNPPSSSRPCQHGEKCPKKHFKRNWEPDKASDRCRHCLKEFTLVKRRSHCRECGKLNCGDCLKEIHPIGKTCSICEFKMKVNAQGREGSFIPSMKGEKHNREELLAKYTDFSPEKEEDDRKPNTDDNNNNNDDDDHVINEENHRPPVALKMKDEDDEEDDNEKEQQQQHPHSAVNAREYHLGGDASQKENDDELIHSANMSQASSLDPASQDNFDVNQQRQAAATTSSSVVAPEPNDDEEKDMSKIKEDNHHQEAESASRNQNDEHNDHYEENTNSNDDKQQLQQEQHQQEQQPVEEDKDELIIQLKQQLGDQIAQNGYEENTTDEFVDILLQLADRYEVLILEITTTATATSNNASSSGSSALLLLLAFYRLQRNEILSRLLSVRETVYGQEHVAAAQILIMIGEAKRHDHLYNESILTLERALRICENEYGLVHDETANVLSHLGVTYHARLQDLMASSSPDETAISIAKENKENFLTRSMEMYEQCNLHDVAEEMRTAWNL